MCVHGGCDSECEAVCIVALCLLVALIIDLLDGGWKSFVICAVFLVEVVKLISLYNDTCSSVHNEVGAEICDFPRMQKSGENDCSGTTWLI